MVLIFFIYTLTDETVVHPIQVIASEIRN